ncbi:tyrosine-type recombinase/integrase [Umezawaea sp. NPDC059074]|uniref:tyrosine-type recombinase/integrase n=1 Tax=Umezawaea sp. NPDC059074 TaxID=3346716 RepID=UPI0036C469B5
MKTTMSGHVDAYLQRQRVIRAKRTLLHQESVLGQFARWRDASHKSPRTLKAWEVEDYLIGPEGLADRLAPNSWNSYMSIICAFLKWGAGRDFWSASAAVDMDKRQGEPKAKLYLDRTQMDVLFEQAPDAYVRFCLAALRYTLCREQELLKIRLSNMNLESNKITIVRTKGKRATPEEKIDRIPILGEFADELDRWLPEYERLCGPLQNNWYLIPRRMAVPRGRSLVVDRWSYSPVDKRALLGPVVKRRVKALLPDLTDEGLHGVGCHTLRRSGGRDLREALRDAGIPEADYIVMAQYGHANVQTSYKYWGETPDRVRRDNAMAGRRLWPQKADVVELKVVAEHAG